MIYNDNRNSRDCENTYDDETSSGDEEETISSIDVSNSTTEIDEICIADIQEDEEPFEDEDKIENQYYIGIAISDRNTGLIIPAGFVSNKTFFKYKFRDVLDYLNDIKVLRIFSRNDKIHIMKLLMVNCGGKYIQYAVVLKTHWISLIQRHWKRAYNHYKYVLNSQKNTLFLKQREINNRGCKLIKPPTICGLMTEYSRKNDRHRH
jgi:hypothetical protein